MVANTEGYDICWSCGKSQDYGTMVDITEESFNIYCSRCYKKEIELICQKLEKMALNDELIFYLPCSDNKNMAVSIDTNKEFPICMNGNAIQFNLVLDKDFEVKEIIKEKE